MLVTDRASTIRACSTGNRRSGSRSCGATSTSGRPIVLRTELGAGHGGPSGRYDAWRDEAMVLAFVCDAVGVDDNDRRRPRRAAHRRRRRARGRVRAAAATVDARHGGAVPSAPAVRRNDAQHRHLGAVRRAARGRATAACASTSAASRAARGSYTATGATEPARRASPRSTRPRGLALDGAVAARRLVVRRRHGALGRRPAHRRLGRHRAAAAIRHGVRRGRRGPAAEASGARAARRVPRPARRAATRSRRGRTPRPKSLPGASHFFVGPHRPGRRHETLVGIDRAYAESSSERDR